MKKNPKITSNYSINISKISCFYMCGLILFIAGCHHQKQIEAFFVGKQSGVLNEEELPGELISIHEYAKLYIPNKTVLQEQIYITLAFHFHTVAPYAIREYMQRGSQNPLIIFVSGSGSDAYKIPFKNTNLFDQLQQMALLELKKMGAAAEAEITDIEISSFSAGYGAVREILKTPAYVRKIKTVVLTDSMYASYADKEKGIPVQENIQSFVDFARLAKDGKKTFLMTYSKVFPETYASTEECVRELVRQVGGRLEPMESQPITELDGQVQYPMIAHYDRKGLHAWGFAGDDKGAHVAHVHALAELWLRMDEN